MKNKKLISLALSVVLTIACTPVCANAGNIPDEAEYVEGEILISSRKEVEDTCGMLQTASTSDTVGIDFEETGITDIEEVEIYTDKENLYVAEVDGDVEKICEELSDSNDIIAEPNYILHTCDFTLPSEVRGSMSNYYKIYQKSYFDSLQISEAWQKYGVTGEGVTVAVIDNGYFYTASDFPKNLWKNSQGTVGWNTNDDDDNILPIMKSDGQNPLSNSSHGSNVAGIIGMKANNGNGIGIAYNATLMLLQAAHYVSDTAQSSFTVNAIIKAIDFARNNGADIINMSIGMAGTSSSLKSAVDRAYNAGVTIIAAAGNQGVSTASSNNRFIPGAYSNVIGVMAVGNSTNPTRLAEFSNYDTSNGAYYNIAAPGEDIFGCAYKAGFTSLSGTSQASPIVAAAAALYFEQNPNSTPLDFKTDLLASSTDRVYAYASTSYTYKSLNVLKLLDYCIPPEINVNLSTDAGFYGNYLTGLNEGYESIEDYISVSNGTLEFIPSANGNGTGSVLNIYNTKGIIYKSYNIVIFGDINGDSYADAQDAVLLNAALGGLGELSEVQNFAADVDFDNLSGASDSDIIQKYAIFDDYISQIR